MIPAADLEKEVVELRAANALLEAAPNRFALIQRYNMDIGSPVRAGSEWFVTISHRDPTSITGWKVVAHADHVDLGAAIDQMAGVMQERETAREPTI